MSLVYLLVLLAPISLLITLLAQLRTPLPRPRPWPC